MGKITTHVLDTADGKPAEGIRITLRRLNSGESLADVTTNSDGRCDAPLLSGVQLTPGRYQIEFHVGDYFADSDRATDEIPFLDVVPVQFGINDAAAHYHIPLLISPYGYNTYRGS